MVTLAQAYGSKTSISCIVVQLTSPQVSMNDVSSNSFCNMTVRPHIRNWKTNPREVSPQSFAESTLTDTDSEVSLDRYMKPEVPMERHYNEDLNLVAEDLESNISFFPSYISPPDQFADTDSEGNSDDSGFSCNSGCKSDSPTETHLDYRVRELEIVNRFKCMHKNKIIVLKYLRNDCW